MILLNYLINFYTLQKREGAAPLEFNVLYVNLGKESVVEKVGVQGLPGRVTGTCIHEFQSATYNLDIV